MRLPVACRIATRDGTLTKDSKMVNCFSEADPDGGVNVVKRPGTALVQSFGASVAQVGFATGGAAFGVFGDTIRGLNVGFTLALPSPVLPNLRMKASDANFLPSNTGISFIKSTRAAWAFDLASFGVTKVTDADYPSQTVPGFAYLDGTYYVMDATGIIYGSDIENSLSWNALNFIATDRGLGIAISITRHLNYVLALCDFGLQFFYDAANATGSPLLPMPNSTCTVGCAHADSVASIEDMTIFMSKNRQRGRSISAISGLGVQAISTPFIDKILNNDDLSSVWAYGIRVAGHSFYVLTLGTSNVTLVCDLTSHEWVQWASGASGNSAFNGAFYCHAEGNALPATQDLLLNPTNGSVYSFLPSTYTDVESSIWCQIDTPIWDQGTIDSKRIARVNLIGDTVNSSVAMSYSKDDYQTYSTPVSIDMSTERKLATRLGRSRRRSFRLTHNANTPLRLKAIEIHPDPTV
jgi:hypothetical protein